MFKDAQDIKPSRTRIETFPMTELAQSNAVDELKSKNEVDMSFTVDLEVLLQHLIRKYI